MTSSQVPLVIDFAAEEDRIPLSLKIALGDQLTEVIGAGTKVPIRREIEISNASDDQDQMTIRIVQGASNRPEANAAVASYVIKGIPLAPRGSLSIRLVLEVTPSLGFNVSADSKGTPFEIEVKDHGRPLGQKAIAALMEEEDRDHAPPFDGTYDRAEYHKQAVSDEELDADQAFVHTGMFVGWLVDEKLLSEAFMAGVGPACEQFVARELTGPALYKLWKGELREDMLGDVANAFARDYFDFKTGLYLEDYAELLAPNGATLLAVEDNWQHYETLSQRLGERYREWTERRANPLK
jgi:hypothetical protein